MKSKLNRNQEFVVETDEASDKELQDSQSGADDEESESEFQSNSDGDDEDEELEAVHDQLLNAIERFSSNTSSVKSKNRVHSSQGVSESIYSVQDAESVSMSALLGALEESKGLGAVKKSLADLEKAVSAPAYVEKVVSDRIERREVYQTTSKSMDKWQDTVVSNRHVKTLDLAQDRREVALSRNIIKKYKPETDLEKEVSMVLIQTSTTEHAAEEQEYSELKAKSMSLEEIREKQAELAKVKALMFYEQMKRHRINKIKSKAFHRIKKRQRAKRESDTTLLAEVDSDVEKDLDEKNALKRVKERMNLRHKNTSKWARMALEHRKTDKSLKAAYHESVQLGKDLTKKMNDDSFVDNTHTKSEESESDDNEDSRQSVISRARRLNQAIESDEENLRSLVDGGKYGTLLNMDFMKKAAENRKEVARKEAQQVLRELQQLESNNGDSDVNSEEQGEAATRRSESLAKAKQEMDMRFGDAHKKGALSMISRTVAASSESAKSESNSWTRQADSFASPDTLENANNKLRDGVESNPWLAAVASRVDTTKREKPASGNSRILRKSSADQVKQKEVWRVPSDPSAGIDINKPKGEIDEEVSQRKSKKAMNKNERKPLLLQKSQADLVQQAFAGPDYEEEFLRTKEQAIDSELGIAESRAKVLRDVKAGWGDWAGPGEMGISSKTIAKRDRLLKAVQEDSDKKRAGRKDVKLFNVMFSEKRVKAEAKFKIGEVPHPFTSREEYERSISMPLGAEWNASHVVRENTRPEILLRAGRIIEPIKLQKKRSAPALADSSGASMKKSQKIKA